MTTVYVYLLARVAAFGWYVAVWLCTLSRAYLISKRCMIAACHSCHHPHLPSQTARSYKYMNMH
jgi:cytochrome c553